MKLHTAATSRFAAAGLVLAGAASAQTTQVVVFSVDYSSDTVALNDSFTGTPITEGDLLAAQTITRPRKCATGVLPRAFSRFRRNASTSPPE